MPWRITFSCRRAALSPSVFNHQPNWLIPLGAFANPSGKVCGRGTRRLDIARLFFLECRYMGSIFLSAHVQVQTLPCTINFWRGASRDDLTSEWVDCCSVFAHRAFEWLATSLLITGRGWSFRVAAARHRIFLGALLEARCSQSSATAWVRWLLHPIFFLCWF